MTSPWAQRLLKWYARHRRRLPWRGRRDPYCIWISEIMLQQTQVETVKPYYRRWLRRFPTVRALAEAPLQEVLTLWEGLGYYARARHLHRAAQQVALEHGGRLPRTVEGLRALPGIGRYTAAAIASIAFNEDVAVLDGNVKRVLARAFDYTGDVKAPAGERDLWALAEGLVPAGRAGDYNQALMDLGATVCTPRAPSCGECPLRGLCRAEQLGVQAERPVTRRRTPTPHRRLAVGLVHKAGRILIIQRPVDELLGGLWAFPSITLTKQEAAPAQLAEALSEQYGLEVAEWTPRATVQHAYTHFRVTAQAYEGWVMRGAAPPGAAGVRVKWVQRSALSTYPMGKIDRRLAQSLQTR